MQTRSSPHALSHSPQLFWSVSRLRQMPEQYCPPDPHPQLPLEHCSLSAQAWPQPPQLEVSVCKFTQDFPHPE
jgi:hypothetical protein